MSKVTKSAKSKFKKLDSTSKVWEVLTEAKKYLSDDYSSMEDDYAGSCTYICHAVSYALCKHPYNKSEAYDSVTHKYIIDQLYPNSSLEGWLARNHMLTDDELEDYVKIQNTRKAWIDHMIKTCKAQDI